jgi:hypothetical protein
VRNELNAALLAAGLTACTATPQDYRNDNEQPLPSGQGAFGQSFTWEWRKRDAAPSPSAAQNGKPAAASAAKPDASATERQEFEEWRAWQEWQRKNPK